MLGENKGEQLIKEIVSKEAPRIAKVCGDKVDLSDMLDENSCLYREVEKSVERLYEEFGR